MTLSIHDFLARLQMPESGDLDRSFAPVRITSLVLADHLDAKAAVLIRLALEVCGPEATVGELEDCLYNAQWWLRLFTAHQHATDQLAAAVFLASEIRDGPIEQAPAPEGHP